MFEKNVNISVCIHKAAADARLMVNSGSFVKIVVREPNIFDSVAVSWTTSHLVATGACKTLSNFFRLLRTGVAVKT